MAERLALNIGNWKNKDQSQIESDFASYLIENKRAPLEEKITYYELAVDQEGKLVSNEFGRILDLIEIQTEQDKKEYEASEKLEHWANETKDGQAIWISPPSKDYSESRFVIFEKKGKQIGCRALCGKESAEDCLKIASLIGGSKQNNVEEVRSNIFPFEAKGGDWINYLEKIFGKSEVWDRIRKKDDLKEKVVTTKIASDIVEKYSRELNLIMNNFHYQLMLGALIEEEAKKYGYYISPSGSCGISNIAALGMVGNIDNSPFDNFFKGNWSQERFFSCPKCGGKIPSGFGITTCPHCGAKKENYGSCI